MHVPVHLCLLEWMCHLVCVWILGVSLCVSFCISVGLCVSGSVHTRVHEGILCISVHTVHVYVFMYMCGPMCVLHMDEEMK